MTTARTATVTRTTTETDVTAAVTLDASGDADVETGLGFLDHMLTTLAKHARIDITLKCTGDLHVDDHHTAEDIAIALGRALDGALSDRARITRFADALAPMDESLCRCAIDLSARAHASVDLALARERIGDIATENITHFFSSFANNARMTLHLDSIRGENDHHKAEAAFKALAFALRVAVTIDPTAASVPSTKGVL